MFYYTVSFYSFPTDENIYKSKWVHNNKKGFVQESLKQSIYSSE